MTQQPKIGKRKLTDAERVDAITPLLKGRCTEERLAARAVEVGVSSRTLHRWIAEHEGRLPSDTKLRFYFPAAALFVAAKRGEGMSVREIHHVLKAEWPTLYPGKPCPCLTTLRVFVSSLSSASHQVRL
jgi:hypothetical protein